MGHHRTNYRTRYSICNLRKRRNRLFFWLFVFRRQPLETVGSDDAPPPRRTSQRARITRARLSRLSSRASSDPMSSGAPNLACEVSLSPIACPRNPGMPEGSLRLVKRRADLAARDPNAGFASAMSELEECASREERDDAVVDATPSSGVAGGADVASPATISPCPSSSPIPLYPQPPHPCPAL